MQPAASAPEDRGGGPFDPHRRHAPVPPWVRPRWRRPGPAGTSEPERWSSSCPPTARRVLLHGDEHPPAGRAPGHRGDPTASTWSSGSSGWPPASRFPGLTEGHPFRATRWKPGSTPRTPAGASCPPPGPCCACANRLAGRVSGSTRRCETGTVVGTDYDPLLAKVVAWGPDRARPWPGCEALWPPLKSSASRPTWASSGAWSSTRTWSRAGLTPSWSTESAQTFSASRGPTGRRPGGRSPRRPAGEAGRTAHRWVGHPGWLAADRPGAATHPVAGRGSGTRGRRLGRGHRYPEGARFAGRPRRFRGWGFPGRAAGRDRRFGTDGTRLLIETDDRASSFGWAVERDTFWLSRDGDSWALTRLRQTVDRTGPVGATAGPLISPMPGTVLAVHVRPGQAVRGRATGGDRRSHEDGTRRGRGSCRRG